MDDLFWNLFRETGEPMGYLLYRAGQRTGPRGATGTAARRGEKQTGRQTTAERPAPRRTEPPETTI